MKHKQSVVFAVIILVAGLLVVASTSLMNHYLTLPDFFIGTLAGFGIGMEIVAVIKLIKWKQLKRANG